MSKEKVGLDLVIDLVEAARVRARALDSQHIGDLLTQALVECLKFRQTVGAVQAVANKLRQAHDENDRAGCEAVPTFVLEANLVDLVLKLTEARP